MTRTVLSVHSQLLGQWIDISTVSPQPADAPWRDPSPQPQDKPVPVAAGILPAARAVRADAQVLVRRPRFEVPRACFLLHGLSGNHTSWPSHMALDDLATAHNVTFICPSLGRSFAINWHSALPWGDFLTQELPLLVAEHLRVDVGFGVALIAGFSMGGYEAFRAALSLPGRYAAAGSFAGVLDMACEANRQRRAELYRAAFATADIAGTDVDLLALLRAGCSGSAPSSLRQTPLWAACGLADHLLPQNRAFRDEAEKLGRPLAYAECEGDHNWDFCRPALRRFLDWAAQTVVGQPAR